MVDHVTIMVAAGALALWALRGRKPRRGAARVDPPPSADRPLPVARLRAPPTVHPAATALPSTRATHPASRPYLLGGAPGDTAHDPTAAMMDMMAGPGLCTPRSPTIDHRPPRTKRG